MAEYKKMFVVSDIHGHCSLLKNALQKAGFDKDNEEHLLVCCGDYFDRGNENVEVLKFFERLKHKVLLRGNHEDLLLEIFETGKILPHNYINGTMQTLSNFFGKYFVNPADDTVDFSGQTRTVDRICEFIDETVNYFETDKYVFVHGWVPDNTKNAEDRMSASDEAWKKARWTKWTDRYVGAKPLSDKILICGHVPTLYAYRFDYERPKNSSDIFYGNGIIALDAATYDTKRVNVLVLDC